MEFVTNLKEEEYNDFVINHPKSHFLQSYEWGEVSRHRGLIPYYVGLKENNKLIATALLLKKQLPFGYSYFYIPRGYTIDYNDKFILQTFTNYIVQFTKKYKSLYFKIDPDIKLHTINEMAEKIEGENNYQLVSYLEKIGFKRRSLTKYFETMQPRYTFRIDLTQNIDDIIKKYQPTARNSIKRADSYNVKVIEGKRENVKDFIRLMKMTEKRQNFYSHDEDFYYKFYDVFSKKNHLKVLLAEIDIKNIINVINEKIVKENNRKKIDKDHLNKLKKEKIFFEEKGKKANKVITSAYFMVYFGNKSWYLYGANDLEFKDTFSNYKIFDYQVKKAKEENIEIFDEFGTIGDPKSKKSIIGIHDFKKKFGGEYIEFIGEFDFVTNKPVNFIFNKTVKLYRYISKKIRHFKVKINN